MTTVETISIVSAMVGIVAAIVGITLAVVAIIFTWRVDSRNNELNQHFAEALTSINAQSASTQAAVEHSVNRVVEAFIDTRVGGARIQPSDVSEDSQTSPTDQRLERMEKELEELRLRQRFQSNAAVRPIWMNHPIVATRILDILGQDRALIEWQGGTYRISKFEDGTPFSSARLGPAEIDGPVTSQEEWLKLISPPP